MDNNLRVLIISAADVPNSPNSIVAGGGVRDWALAQGLIQNGISTQIAVPYSESSLADDIVQIYRDMDQLIEIGSRFDVVIASPSTVACEVIFNRLPEKVIRIADAFVPVHLEISASTAGSRLEFDELKFTWFINLYMKRLWASDLYLVASTVQRSYLVGLLSGTGLISPSSYDAVDIAIAPIGVDASAPVAVAPQSGKTILWWGGFYPWYDFENLYEWASLLLKLEPETKIRIVGALNPFTSDRLFRDIPQVALEKLTTLPNVDAWDWLPYSERSKAFEGVSAVLILNGPNFENEFSWRTRFVDPIAFGMPILTNGGDPFGEVLLEAGGALRTPSESAKLANWIAEEMTAEALTSARSSIVKVKEKFSWKSSAESLATHLKEFDAEAIIAARALREIREAHAEKSTLGEPRGTYILRARLQQARYVVENEGVKSTIRRISRFATKKLLRRG